MHWHILIVGYNEESDTGSQRGGSHNIVVGDRHNYTSYGGFVAGRQNTISDSFASVRGGYGNTASGGSAGGSGGLGSSSERIYCMSTGETKCHGRQMLCEWVCSNADGSYYYWEWCPCGTCMDTPANGREGPLVS